jgi:hypothetical protein
VDVATINYCTNLVSLAIAHTCSPPSTAILPSNFTAIADKDVSGNYFMPSAAVTGVNYNAPPTTVSIANGGLLHSAAQAMLNLQNLPPDTGKGHIMNPFTNNLFSVGLFCNAVAPLYSPIHLPTSLTAVGASYSRDPVNHWVLKCGNSTYNPMPQTV